jgi:hypothetical protein
MARNLSIKFKNQPSLVINRTAFKDDKLVYIIRANRKLRYRFGDSRIAYIGTTRKGARRIASSAVGKGEDLLYRYGIKHLELHIVTCGKIQGIESWKKLERALILRFRESFGDVPVANSAYKNGHWRDEKNTFRSAISTK